MLARSPWKVISRDGTLLRRSPHVVLCGRASGYENRYGEVREFKAKMSEPHWQSLGHDFLHGPVGLSKRAGMSTPFI